LSAIASNKRSEGRAEAVLQRVTVTIDDELMDALERYMLAGGHQNRCREPCWLENIRIQIEKAIKRENSGQ
jgi:metal-responsive CopG/Arc/MetJ family transcriptional regulator